MLFKQLLLLGTTIALLFCQTACEMGQSDDFLPGNGLNTLRTTVYGIVTNENLEPIEGARVWALDVPETLSDANGVFMLPKVSVNGQRFVVYAEKEGFFKKTFANMPQGGRSKINLLLIPKQTATFNAAEAYTLQMGTATAELPANGFVDAQNGSTYSGTIQAAYRHLSPSDELFGLAMPGTDFMAKDTQDEARFLVSYGAVGIELSGSNGEALQLSPGSIATLRMTIPESHLAEAPATIPLWYFDEATALWREEGTATREGNEYIGTVTHFTWWNCDYPVSPTTFVKGRVVDCAGNPVAGVAVNVGPLIVTTDENGYYYTNIPANLDFSISINPALTWGITIDELYVPGVPEGTTYYADDLVLPCLNQVQGRVADCEDSPLEALVTIQSNGNLVNVTMSTQGNFNTVIGNNTEDLRAIARYSSPILGVLGDTISSFVEIINNDMLTYDAGTINLTCITHFTGKVTDCYDTAITAQISAYWAGGSYSVASNGMFSLAAPANTSITIVINTTVGTDSVSVVSPNSKETSDLGIFKLPCPATISGIVTDCGGSPVPAYLVVSWQGGGNQNGISDNVGAYNLTVPGGADLNIGAFSLDGTMVGTSTISTVTEQNTVVPTIALCDIACNTISANIVGVSDNYVSNNIRALRQVTTSMTNAVIHAKFDNVVIAPASGSVATSPASEELTMVIGGLTTGIYTIGTNASLSLDIELDFGTQDCLTLSEYMGTITIDENSDTRVSGSFDITAWLTVCPEAQGDYTSGARALSGMFCVEY